jgi:NADPH:quinone reductase-like Zn-dependent oxidoreductase
MTATGPHDFLVKRDNLRETRLASAQPALADGQVLLAIDKFALTANNITYAVFGQAMQYWNFFPPAADQAGWGRVPVWGFADVTASKHADIRVGERVYGYLPMSTHLVVQPGRVTNEQFMDSAEHRRPLPTPYQVYGRCAHDPLHDPAHEDARALLHPLFFTSWLIDDFLADNALFGATQVVLASASSKTALGVAFLLRQRGGCRIVGLTSKRNKAFCEKVGYYDEVITYDNIAAVSHSHPTVFVDMAGDGKLLHAVHHHFRDQLKYSCIVGATHWEDRATQHQLPGAKPQFFFAPTQVQKRSQDWTYAGLQQRLGEGWRAFLPSVSRWLDVKRDRGPEAVRATYLEVLEGRQPPTVGHMLSL